MKFSSLLLVSQLAPPDRGGVERFLDELLTAWVNAGYSATAVAPKGKRFTSVATLSGDLFPWRFLRPSYFPLLWKLPQWRRRAGAEFVLFGHATNAMLPAAILSHFGFRFGVLVHGMDVRRMPRRLARWCLNSASAVFANSSATSDYLRSLGIDVEPILLTPGVNVPDRVSSRSDPHILVVGRLVARKGIATVIRALTAVASSVPTVRLIVVGDGPELPALQQLARDRGVGERIIFTGPLSDREVAQQRETAAVTVLVPEKTADPSDVEGFGLVLAEAQAAGIPVVTADQPGVREAVAPGGALFVEPGDVDGLAHALIELLTTRARSDAMAAAGRAWATTTGAWARRADLVHTALSQDLSDSGTISVVIPAYNVEQTLEGTIRSIRTQVGVQTEIVVVDDGSSDGTLAKAKALGVHALHQSNAGAPSARNHGARETRGAFLFFCDADIALKLTALREMLRALLTHPNASYAYCSFWFGWRAHRCGPFDAEKLRRYNYITTMSVLRREDFPGFDESIRRLQDWDLWLTLLDAGKVGTWVPKYLFWALPRGGGISGRVGGPPPEDAVRRILEKHATQP